MIKYITHRLRRLAFLLLILCVETVNGQNVALRTNLLYDATLTPNIGVEVRIDTTWTLGANVGLNAWDINKEENKKWRHILVAPHVRKYFLRDDSLRFRRTSYVEGNLIYSHFNVGNTTIPLGLYSGAKNRRLQGDLLALGAKYGYAWMMARDWWIEAEAGIAIGYAWFKEYDCAHCGTFYGRGDRIFLLPQLGINVIYIIN